MFESYRYARVNAVLATIGALAVLVGLVFGDLPKLFVALLALGADAYAWAAYYEVQAGVKRERWRNPLGEDGGEPL